MEPTSNAPLDSALIVRALQASKSEAAAGRVAEADQILAQVAHRAPNHPAVLNELGVRMLERGAADQAAQLFQRATTADPNAAALWANYASSLRALGRRAEELDAIEAALRLDPRHISALLQRATFFEETGDIRSAARTYQHALSLADSGAAPPPAIAAALAHARTVVDADHAELTALLEAPLAAIRERHGGRRQRRVDGCMDILMGRKAFHPSAPTWMYFPELPTVEFFDREDFPWLDGFEAEFLRVRSELLRVLTSDRDSLQPYIDFSENLPLDQFRELNRSRRWSAYFLWNQGEAVDGHIARCPVTAGLLEAAPRCHIASRAPTAFFSILDAKTHIPTHTGVTNTRVTCHLPLVVPPDCGFRVGATTREWIPGKAWVFDDTIGHEAWNQSDTPRAILLFDVWNPFLTAAEREIIKAATELYVQHYQLPPEPFR